MSWRAATIWAKRVEPDVAHGRESQKFAASPAATRAVAVFPPEPDRNRGGEGAQEAECHPSDPAQSAILEIAAASLDQALAAHSMTRLIMRKPEREGRRNGGTDATRQVTL